MIVVVDGEEESRVVASYETEARRYIPELRSGEEVLWVTGDYRPHIIRRSGFSASEPTQSDCPQCGYPYYIARCSRCNYEGA